MGLTYQGGWHNSRRLALLKVAGTFAGGWHFIRDTGLKRNWRELGVVRVLLCLKLMPRKPRNLQSDFPYHVTLRALNKVNFPVPPEILWEFVCDHLLFCSFAFKVEIHAFVLMSNHYHMIVRTPECNLDKFLGYFHKELSREICFKSGQINHRFGGRYQATVIDNVSYYGSAYKYVYRNPVTAGICSRVQDYTFSSLSFLTWQQKLRFPIFDTYFDSIHSYDLNLAWLNQTFELNEYRQIKSAMNPRPYTKKDLVQLEVPATFESASLH
jgi:REP element-mobilizing transposase RayT